MVTRRHALAAGFGFLAAASRAVAEAAEALIGPPVRDYPVVRLSDHVFSVQAADGFPTPQNQGMMCNILFVIGDRGAFCIDSGASVQIGRMALRQLAAVTDKPVIGVLNTHYHGDHWLGNHAFVEAFGPDLPIYAHADARIAMQGRHGAFWLDALIRWTNGATRGTKPVYPNADARDGEEIDLGGVRLRLLHGGVAHTPTDIAVEVLGDGVLCCGDIVMDRRIANMDDGSFAGSFAMFDRLEAETETTIWVPAHGVAGPGVLDWQRRLFAFMYEHAEAAAKDWLTVDDVYRTAEEDPRYAAFAAETAGWDSNIRKYLNLAFLEAEQAQL